MSFGGFEKNGNSPISEINTTPLVDVMLVLLIIFIVTAPLITSTTNVNLPQTKTAASTQKPDVAKISIDEKGQVFWNGLKVGEEDLRNLLNHHSKKSPDAELLLEIDRSTRYQEITNVMSEAKQAGISKLGFVTKIEK